MFQILRDEWTRHSIEVGRNDPQLAMANQAPFLEKWLCGMTWVVCWNRWTLPFLTSDNPVVMWADRGEGAEIGVGFQEPKLQILFPLTPKLCLNAVQTPVSLEEVSRDSPFGTPQFTDFYPLRIDRGWLDIEQVVKFNQVTVSNAERYVYADRNQDNVRRFLENLFFGRSGPVRRSDRKPIGSEIGPDGAAL